MISDLNGNVWQGFSITTENSDDLTLGLLCFLISSEEWLLFNENNSPLPSNVINGIAVDITNSKWITTNEGLAVYNEQGIVSPEQLTRIDTLNFEALVDSTVTKPLVIYNTTNENLQINSIDISLSEFSAIVSLPVTIPEGDSLIIFINFQPGAVERYTGNLTLFTNKGMYLQVLCGKGVLTLDSNNIESTAMDYSLGQNYPNPFNPTSTIKYQIPERGFITLNVYDVLGNEVVTIVNEEKPIGSYEVEFDGANLSSGIYYYRMRARDFVDTKKLILLK
jgi:hypothetical protein